MQPVSTMTRTEMEATNSVAYPDAVIEFDYNRIGNVTINAPDSVDEGLFPKTSVLEQRYTDSGLPAAIVGQSRAMSQSSDVQYRVVSEDDTYQYWVSPEISTTNSLNNAWMEIHYDRPRPTNKIVAVFEVSYARPTSVTISAMRSGTWVTQGSGLSPNVNGVIELTIPESNIEGVRVQVNQMSTSGVRANFIGVSGRFRVPMTDRVVSMDVQKTMENPTVFAPIGDSSVNVASLSLENSDNVFNPDNTASPYYGAMTRNMKVETFVESGTGELIPQGTFYTESWSRTAPSVDKSISCSDITRFMQETFIQPFALENYRASEAVREVLQRSGFNIKAGNFILSDDPIIPYVWYNEQVSVWEALSDISNATLAYFYVDENDDFFWIDFESLSNKTVSQELNATDNIIDLSHNFEIMANSVNIEYNTYGEPINSYTGGPMTQELWTPGGDEVLLSMPLRNSLSPTADRIYIATPDEDVMALWPTEGMVSVQGEYIRYSSIDLPTRSLRGLTRGVNHTSAKDHTVENFGSLYSYNTVGTQHLLRGNLSLRNARSSPYYSYTISQFGDAGSSFTVYGTSVRIDREGGDETAGLVINRRGGLGGIYIQLTTTQEASSRGTKEVVIYRRAVEGGQVHVYKAVQGNIALGAWYDIEVTVNYTSVNPQYAVYLNGSLVASFEEQWRNEGMYGPFVRGNTGASFTRVYVADARKPITGTSFQDVESGSSFSSDYVFHTGDPNISVNEFAPQVRQVKEYNIDYSLFPAKGTSVLNTNIWQARVVNFHSTPFGAYFLLENKSDKTAVVNGESPNLFPEDDPISMYLMVYGIPIVVKSEERKTVKDTQSIRRNGLVELEVSTPWIQTDEMANRAANLIVSNFSEPMDTVTMNAVPDYSIQLGDVVAVEYQEYGYNPADHIYYVVGIGTTWSDGFTQQLTLKRKR